MSDTNQTTGAAAGAGGESWSPGTMPDFYRPEQPAGGSTPPQPSLPDITRKQPAIKVEPAPAAAKPAVPAEDADVMPVVTRRRRRTRKARLRLSRIDPWSVMKTSFLFSVAFGIMFWVATYVLWSVIGASGLFDAANQFLQQILSNPNDQTQIRIEDYVNTNKVLGVAALIAVVNVVILTALGTLTAFLYNLSANVLGGLEVTLAED